MIKEFMNEESGQGMAEYALIIALVGVALIMALKKLSGGINNVFDKATNELQSADPNASSKAPAATTTGGSTDSI